MLSALAGYLIAASVQDSPRLRTILPNGAVVFAERFPGEKRLSVQLFASSRGVEETPATHGFRHLLEHLILSGPEGKLDEECESKGLFITGRTFRDAMQFEVYAPKDGLATALDAIQAVLTPRRIDADSIARECSIMAQEFATQPDSARLGRALWTAAYGEEGLDPFGSLEAMGKATPEDLARIRDLQFRPSNLVLSITGDIDIDAATRSARKVLEGLADRKWPSAPARKAGKAGRVEVEDAFGEARGARVPGFREPETAATLCAAFGIASQFPTSFVTYTPSMQPGLVMLGRTDEPSGVGTYIDGADESEVARLFTIGKNLARSWWKSQMGTPSGNAYLRGFLYVMAAGNRPDGMGEAIERVDWPAFSAAFARFKVDSAVSAVGMRR